MTTVTSPLALSTKNQFSPEIYRDKEKERKFLVVSHLLSRRVQSDASRNENAIGNGGFTLSTLPKKIFPQFSLPLPGSGSKEKMWRKMRIKINRLRLKVMIIAPLIMALTCLSFKRFILKKGTPKKNTREYLFIIRLTKN